jgi:hypothetical protein
MFGVNKAYKSPGFFGVLFLAPKKLMSPLGGFLEFYFWRQKSL